jgi:hypothetical protein
MSDEPLDPSGIAQFVHHDRCPRYLKQRVEPGDEPSERNWREAFGLMNVALLGQGREFEATQIEALAAGAETIIGPEIDAPEEPGVPDIAVDETWAASARDCVEQLQTAVEQAAALTTNANKAPYILLYQAPLTGQLGAHDVHGDADCIVLAPADAVTTEQDGTATPGHVDAGHDDTALTPHPATGDAHIGPSEPASVTADQSPDRGGERTGVDVIARVIDCKSASDEQAAHRVQITIYGALLEQALAEGPTDTTWNIEGCVLTQTSGVTERESLHPFDLTGFQRDAWAVFVNQLLRADGAVADALANDLDALGFTIDQVCDNCAYREACMTRAVEDPTDRDSLAMLGYNPSVQTTLRDHGITSLADLSELAPREDSPHPTDDPPAIDLPPTQRRALERALPDPIHVAIQRAQALRGELDPEYPAFPWPPAIPGTDWIPLPDDRCEGWGTLDTAAPGELIHVALVVRPGTTDHVAALGACVYAQAHGEYHTIGEVTDAVPDDPELAADVEAALLERFLERLFEAIETVGTELGTPSEAVLHCYTYSDHETETLTDALERHATMNRARALRALLSLHPDGHTGVDQAMITAVQPILNDHFVLTTPNQGLLTVAEQFIQGWTLEVFDPLDGRPDDPPLRAIFDTQFLDARAPYLTDDTGIRVHLGREPLAEGPIADITGAGDDPTPDGWYPIRKRAGTQFPIEYIWACTPKYPTDSTPRLTPDVVSEWDIDAEHRDLYTQEITRYYYRTGANNDRLQQRDLEYLLERLGYALVRLVDAIPYKDAYINKEPLDVTDLDTFSLSVGRLPEAARDYLRMEFGAQRAATLEHYRGSRRERVRTGRSVPVRCTEYEHQADGGLTITGELAYDAVFPDEDTAREVARQARVRDAEGATSGSWRLLTRLQTPTTTADTPHGNSATTGAERPSARGPQEAGVEDPTDLKHSPPVLINSLDTQTGEITLQAFPHQFRRNGSEFRVDHCGWHSPEGSNLDAPEDSPSARDGYVGGRNPVWIDTGEVYMLDPMVDDMGAPKADRALIPDTIEHNALWRQLDAIQATGRAQGAAVCAHSDIDSVLETMADTEGCLVPNDEQAAFIRAVDRAIVPLQGPPGTGKTSGATAPALLARAIARARMDESFFAVVVAPSHEATDTVLDAVVDVLDTLQPTIADLSTVELLRVLPTTPPPTEDRPDATTPTVDVTYCDYHTATGMALLQDLATTVCPDATSGDDDTPTNPNTDPETAHGATTTTPSDTSTDTDSEHNGSTAPRQCLLFATPATLYRVLGVFADSLPAIDGTSAPAAMRYTPGLVDVVCIDEASMLTLPQLLLAGSALKHSGQTLLVGDHRQLASVTEHDWTDTLRKPLQDTQAYRSALEYIRLLPTTTPAPEPDPPSGTSQPTSTRHQSTLTQFEATHTETDTSRANTDTDTDADAN